MSDGGNDADRRRWTHKRAQFDNAIHSARLLGFIQKLANGEARYQDTLRTLLDVNASADQSQYVAETLAMKKEVRGIARLEFHPEVAVFFSEVARLIPKLTDGLASQVMMLLGHAAQNDAYLDTVSNAVSELLADLDHPLNREARNYLRLLWDQMEATRRLKQTEALFPGSSIPPPSGPHREPRDSGKLPKAAATHLEPSPAPGAVSTVEDAESLNKTAKMEVPSAGGFRAVGSPADAGVAPGPPAAHWVPDDPYAPSAHRAPEPSTHTKTKLGVAAPVHLQPDWAGSGTAAPETEHQETLRGTGATQNAAVAPHAPAAGHDKAFDDQANDFFNRSETPQPESLRDSARDWRPSPTSRPPPPAKHETDVKLPTNSVPRWAVITASLAVAGVVAAVVYFTREPEPAEPPPAPSAGTAGPSANGSAALLPKGNPKLSASQPLAAPPPPPPPPPPAPAETHPAEPSKPAGPDRLAVSPSFDKPSVQASKSAPPRVAVDSPSVHAHAPAKASAERVVKSAPEKPAISPEGQTTRAPTVVTPPEVAKNLSPLDRIIAELRLISPDAIGIEEKARELSRIIATSKRKDAFYIIDHLGPPVALDALGRDPVLEESLRTFAISTLGRVALDDDDSRAVSAIFMLGEWAKSGGKGRQKAIAALESLTKERIIKGSAPRQKALRAARSEID